MESLWDSKLVGLLTVAIQRVQSHIVDTTRSPSNWLSGKVSGIAAVSPLPNVTTHFVGSSAAVDACHNVEKELLSILSVDNSGHALYLPEKRSLGTSGRWLGIHFLAQLGIEHQAS